MLVPHTTVTPEEGSTHFDPLPVVFRQGATSKKNATFIEIETSTQQGHDRANTSSFMHLEGGKKKQK